MEKIALYILQLIAPAFVAGYAFGWMETMQYIYPEVKYDPNTILSLRSAVLLQSLSLAGIAASLFAFREGEESFFGGVMAFVSAMGLAFFYFFFSTPYVILALITGFNFPYVFCVITWAGPALVVAIIRILDDL